MSRRNNQDFVPLSDLFVTVPAPLRSRAPRSKALIRGLTGSVAIGLVVAALAAPFVAIPGLGVRAAMYAWADLPSELPAARVPERSVMLAADGSPIATLFSEDRIVVPFARVPQKMRDALIAIEDNRFYQHNGVDYHGIGRAALNNQKGGAQQGASTLTQQYVKNVLLSTAKTPAERDAAAGASIDRKIREAKLALRVEQTMTKDQILEGYFNIAYFGDGVYGIGTAAVHYFGVQVEQLTVTQAATLAGLVKNPNGYNPAVHPEQALARRNLVIGRMVNTGKISGLEAVPALASPLGLTLTQTPNGCTTSPYPFFCSWVRQTLADDPAFGRTPEERQEKLYLGGITIQTTLDPAKQKAAQAAVDRAVRPDNRVATALVSVEPGTGKVVAMVTNRRFGKDGPGQTEVLLPTVPAFQPGSTFKAITLATALQQGIPPEIVIDAPNRYIPPGKASPPGGFGNSSEGEAGVYDAATATALSVNTWFVRLEDKTGVLAIADTALRMGVTSIPRTGPKAITDRDASLTLGAYEVSPLEMAGVYATLAAHGKSCRPLGIAGVKSSAGKTLPTPDPQCRQALSPGVADTVTSILAGVIDGPLPNRTGSAAALGRPAAGKTGTTNDYGAAWFSGYTPQLATSVWMGDPRGPSYNLVGVQAYGTTYPRVFGGTIPAPIWADAMKGMLAGAPPAGFAGSDAFTENSVALVVPDVRGLEAGTAARVLASAGLLSAVVEGPSVALRPDGRVVTSQPAPGQVVPPGGTVTITTAGPVEKFSAPPLSGAAALAGPAH